MDLLDDFDRVRATFSELGAIGARIDSSLTQQGAAPGSLVGGSSGYELPGLAVDASVRQAARGRGQLVAAACAADVIVLATSRGYLLRYTWDEYGNEKVVEVELTRQADTRVRALWLDPSGVHTLAALRGPGGGHELLYLHSSWTKPRPLGKLRGLAVSAVGWQKQPASGGAAAAAAAGGGAGEGRPGSAGSGGRGAPQDAGSEDSLLYSTGDVILGSESGSLHVTCQEARSKREGGSSLLLDFKDTHKAICSVEQEQLPGGRRVVLLVTPDSLHITMGGPTLQAVFARYTSGSPWEPLLEVETPSRYSQLHLLRGSDPASLPARFAWLVGGLLLHGHLLLAQLADDAAVGDAAEFVGDMRQLRLGPPDTSPEDEAWGLACSEYHYLLLYPDRLVALNQVSGKVVAELPWGPGTSSGSSSMPGGSSSGGIVGTPLGLMQDGSSGAIQLWSNEALHDVSMSNEGRDMWRTYLEHQDFTNALKLAAGPGQRDVVYHAMGTEAAAAGDWKAAGGHFGRIVSGKPAFEELALMLVEAGEPEGLTAFLTTKLQVLGPSDKAQATMVAAWLTELLLDQINRDLLAAAGQHTPAYLQHVEQLRSFLSQQAPVLNWNTTTALLESYGRLEELEVLAGAKGDHEALLEYLMRNPDGARRALGVLRKPSVGPQLVYRFAPELLAAATQETVDFLVSAGDRLNPRQLLPALVRFGEPNTPQAKRDQVLTYVAYAMEQLHCTDSAVANLAVALLSLDEGEARLLDFLARARTPLGQPLFDPKYGLRLAKERNRRRACVKLLCELGLYEDAVSLALAVDLSLAKAVANGPEDDDGLRRKLWLSIAKHVVQGGDGGQDAAGAGAAGAAGTTPTAAAGGGGGGEDDGPEQAVRIKMAVEFLKEAGGLLKIEDILPFFPDFVTIDNFKGAITDSLTRYNRQIEELKAEMDEATEIAEAVRRDLKLLSSRTAVVSSAQLCVACGRGILDPPPNPHRLPAGGAVPPFYLFPSGQAFHVLCAAGEVVAYGGEARAARTRKLLARLARAEPGAARAPAHNGFGEESVAALAGKLEEEVGCEDPWNGELLVRMIDMPFIDPARDAEEIDSWRI